MKLIRRSEIVEFLRCRKLWSYKWIENLEPRRPEGVLFAGTLFHKFVEYYYNENCDFSAGYNAMEQLFNETDTSRMEQVELDDLWNLMSKVVTNYAAQWGNTDRNWDIVATELTFAIPLDGELYYTGTVDLLFKDSEGRLLFADHKLVSSLDRYQSKVELDTQISCYYWALQQLSRGNGLIWDKNISEWLDINSERCAWYPKGLEPSQFIYNIILRDYPIPPEPLKKGGLSKARNQKTTYGMYLQALVDNDIVDSYDFDLEDAWCPPPEYKEILDHLAAQETEHGNRFFRRIPVTRSEHQVQTAMHELLATTLDIEYVQNLQTDFKKDGWHAYDPIYRNATHDCSWCNYRSLCVAEFDNVNADFVRNTLYKQKENDNDRGERIDVD